MSIEREVVAMKMDGVKPEKIKTACDAIFFMLNQEKFTLAELDHLIAAMKQIMYDMTANASARQQVGDFDYYSSIKKLSNSRAASKTES